MACFFNLRSDGLTGADAGGTWTYNGYNATYNSDPLDSSYVDGGEITNLVGDDPQVNPQSLGLSDGYYSFTYTVTCGGTNITTSIIVEVLNGVCAGGDDSLTVCDSETSLDIFAALAVNSPCGSVTSGGTWVHTGGVAFDTNTGIFNPNQAGAGNYTFGYTVAPEAQQSGYTLLDDADCDCEKSAQIDVTVTEAPDSGTPNSISVCNS